MARISAAPPPSSSARANEAAARYPLNTLPHADLPHLTRITDLDDRAILDLFAAADEIRQADGRDGRANVLGSHSGRIVAMLFYEPSTRTRLSFESASLRLGADVIGFADPKIASVSKGESLIDTIRTVQRYADAIVIRHPAEGAAMLASQVAAVPIINAGDGGHEHPTQTLFDLYTIHQRFPSIAGRTIGMTGDLLYGRTVHSLAKAAAHFGAKLVFIAPEQLQVPPHLREPLVQQTNVRIVSELDEVIADLDVLYVTRVQTERMDEAFKAKLGTMPPLSRLRLGNAKSNLLILHPLPRVDEIAYDVDDDERAWYFEQVANGVVMRMAILDRVLSLAQPLPLGAVGSPLRIEHPPWKRTTDLPRCVSPKCVTNTEHSIAQRSDDDTHCLYCDRPLPV